MATYLGEVLEDQRDKLQENLLANNSKYKCTNVKRYICRQDESSKSIRRLNLSQEKKFKKYYYDNVMDFL